MTDNIMPHRYLKTLLPRLAEERLNLSIFYEQKANLSLAHLVDLHEAGVRSIQPGIEALSSQLLRRMRKGVQARQNLALLRYARALGMEISWNLLWGFPGDDVSDYEETLKLVPLLHHLPPPEALWHISLDRFSPYFVDPEAFGVRNLRPLASYFDFLPETADVARIAYHFTGEYESGAHDHLEVIQKLWRAVTRWRRSWGNGNGPGEELRVLEKNGDYVLADRRKVARVKRPRILSRDEAAMLLVPRPYTPGPAADRAVEEKLAVVLDGWLAPLAVAETDLLAELGGTAQPAVLNVVA